MNHMLVAELLAEDALLKECYERLDRALSAADSAEFEKVETLRLKHTNLRTLILAEMDKPELELYEVQRDHNFSFH